MKNVCKQEVSKFAGTVGTHHECSLSLTHSETHEETGYDYVIYQISH